jgi:hypothetical protein
VIRNDVSLHFVAARLRMIFELAASRIECIAYRDVDILVCVVLARVAADHDRSARDGNRDPDIGDAALPLIQRKALNGTGRDLPGGCGSRCVDWY